MHFDVTAKAIAAPASTEAPKTECDATAKLTLSVYIESESDKLKEFRTTKRPTQGLYDA
jgi:hypothetical protein